MSDLAATNCQNVNNGCDGGFGNCLFPLLLLCCCGNGNGFGGNEKERSENINMPF